MKRYLKMIQTGLGVMIFALMFNNCSKVGFNSQSSTPSTKAQSVGDLGIAGIENAVVDKSLCASDDDGDDGDDGNGDCYALCHVPPGNAANEHTIYVGFPALAHHVENHESHDDDTIKDHAGECGSDDGAVENVDGSESTDVDAA